MAEIIAADAVALTKAQWQSPMLPWSSEVPYDSVVAPTALRCAGL